MSEAKNPEQRPSCPSGAEIARGLKGEEKRDADDDFPGGIN